MATDIIEEVVTLTASLQQIRLTPPDKRDLVDVFISNDGADTTWRMQYTPVGGTAVVLVPGDNLSAGASGITRVPVKMAEGGILEASSPGTAVDVFVNGISQDL